jgi:SIR2-like protein
MYHVHGFLPRDGEVNPGHDIILSEQAYHAQYSDMYSWSNLVQINKFRDNTCLYIGQSCLDPNLRRLLGIAQQQRGEGEYQHFLIRKHYSTKEVKSSLSYIVDKERATLHKGKEEKGHSDMEESASALVALMEACEENDSASCGVSVVWVDEYQDIPKIIQELREG